MARPAWWLLALALGGCRPAELPPGDVAEGKQLYDKYCRLCHAEAGRGYAADNASQLGNQQFLSTVTDRLLYVAIERGRSRTAMAAYGQAYGGPLASRDIHTIIGYLRSLQTVPTVDVHRAVGGDAAAGAALFDEHCAACHGPGARGGTAPSLNRSLFLVTASNGFLRYAIAKGRGGTPMPAYEDKLEAEQIDHLVRYLRSLAGAVPEPVRGELPPTFEQVVINPEGPRPELGPLREGRYVPAERLRDALADGARVVILDARPTSDWLNGHIPGALPVPYYDESRMMDRLPRDGTWIVSYCACPHAASGHVMDALRAAGFRHTAVIDEGILVWAERGYPMTAPTAK